MPPETENQTPQTGTTLATDSPTDSAVAASQGSEGAVSGGPGTTPQVSAQPPLAPSQDPVNQPAGLLSDAEVSTLKPSDIAYPQEDGSAQDDTGTTIEPTGPKYYELRGEKFDALMQLKDQFERDLEKQKAKVQEESDVFNRLVDEANKTISRKVRSVLGLPEDGVLMALIADFTSLGVLYATEVNQRSAMPQTLAEAVAQMSE